MPLNNGSQCDMEVAHNFVATPTNNGAYGVHIDIDKEERHGTNCSKGSCRNVVGLEAHNVGTDVP